MNYSSCVPRKRKSVNTMWTSSLSKPKVPDNLNTTAMRRGHSALPSRLQFFVRILSDHTHVLRAHPQDMIRTIHEKIQSITGIPVTDQRLIYRGKQLRWEQTLSAAGVENDAALHLVGRMRSTENLHSWQLVNDIVSHLFYLSNDKPFSLSFKTLDSMLTDFIAMTPYDPEEASAHLHILSASSAPAALVMLHMSDDEDNAEAADIAIKLFLDLPKQSYPKWVPIVLDFCELLSRFAGTDDLLYGLFRSRFGTMMVECCSVFGEIKNVGLRQVFPFVTELAAKLSKDMVASTVPSMSEVDDFASFIISVRNGIKGEYKGWLPFADEMMKLHGIFLDLLSKLERCLEKTPVVGGRQCLALLKVLNSISKLYPDCEEVFWESMKQRKGSLCSLIVSCVYRGDDHSWISECKEVTTSEARRHLAMMLVPDGGGYNQKVLIDRANLLAESLEYILNADLDSLRAGLRMEFKDEVATGPGVLREWFLLVCQEIFNPDKNPLFVACPDDRKRFFPNPALSADRKHFSFVGKVIALALMHKVQVGIVFDRVFFQQLAENKITLEDVKDADPLLYRSCKQILEMDAETVDRDALGLTFVHEIEEMGTRRVVEICPGGKSVVVNSDNRRQYVDCLIQHLFVKQTAQKVEHFAEGFGDIFNSKELKKSFFRCLHPEDLELMLRGSGDEISVDDWKAHTDYNGFKATDKQIKWFWKIVENMTKEEKMVLLFFWTSIKYLPSQGFRGLASRPHISKTRESRDRLPSSHTCFYGLCLPAYPTKRFMRKRLRIITQEHVSCSFGTL